jgi:hypothetical protein
VLSCIVTSPVSNCFLVFSWSSHFRPTDGQHFMIDSDKNCPTVSLGTSGVTTPILVTKEAQQHNIADFGKPTKPVDDAPREDYPNGMLLVPILVSTLCSVFLVSLDMTIIGTAIPKITDEFKGLDMVSWVSLLHTHSSPVQY